MKINFLSNLIIIVILITAACSRNNKTAVSGVSISLPGNNVLSVQVEAHTNTVKKAFIKYWIAGQKEKSLVSQTCEGNTDLRFLLSNLKSGTEYVFNIITSGKISNEISQDYFFNTIDYSNAIQDTLSVVCKDTSLLPQIFKEGNILIHKREVQTLYF